MSRSGIIAFNYFGGKATWIDELEYYFPKHDHFVDVFCGSMSVTLNKRPSKLDTANDIDSSIFNFFKVLREKPEQLIEQLKHTIVSRQEYTEAWPVYEADMSDLEHARRFFVRCRMSYQGTGLKEHTGFNACVTSSEKGKSKNVNKYYSAVSKLPEVIKKLQLIQIENLDYKILIEKYDRPGTFFYCDPPYELRQRNYKKWYSHEFSDEDHGELSDILNNVQGKVMISGYESDMYHDLFKDWYFTKLPERNHSVKNKPQVECIWTNYDPDEQRGQLKLLDIKPRNNKK